jgi:hypothetical protein
LLEAVSVLLYAGLPVFNVGTLATQNPQLNGIDNEEKALI